MVDRVNSVPAGVTQAGLAYDYPNPPLVATLTLVNIQVDPDHQNIGLNRAAYDTFIDAQIAASSDPTQPGEAAWTVTDQVIYDPEYSPNLPIDYDTATRLYNYGRLTIGSRAWYVFYTPVYKTATVTKFIADIDEFPSFDWELGYSMVERGHIAVAASQEDTTGDAFLTAPEPIEAPPVRGVLDTSLLGAHPSAWTVEVISANDLRGNTFGPERFWELHILNPEIASASTLASAATINSSGTVQTDIDAARYPWSTGSPPSPPTGRPANGFVPDDDLAVLATAAGPNPARAEVNTAAAWAEVVANYPSAHISATVSGAPASPAGYWDHDLDVAIHADPSLYGITDPDLAPIGHSDHGWGIRINVGGVSPAQMAQFGFSEFNSYTFTFQGPFVWDEPTPGTLEVFVPQVVESPVSTIDGVPAGGGVYLFTMEGFAEYMTIMQGAPWVIAGIVDIRLVPSWAVSGGGDATFSSAVPSRDPSDPMWVAAASIPVFRAAVVSSTTSPTVLANWRDTLLAAADAEGYRKLLTAPFTDILVGNGESLTSFRPDQWDATDIAFEAVTGAAHGDPSIRLIPTGYNELGSQMGVDTPVGGQPGTTHSGFGVAASNVGSADAAPFMSAYGTNASWQVQFRQRELAQTLGLEQVQLQLAQAGISSALGAVTGAAKGALKGSSYGPQGAVIGGALGAGDAASSLVNAAISADNTIQLLDISTDGSFDIGAFQLGIAGEAAVYTFDAWWQALASAPGGGTGNRMASAWRAILGQAFEVIIAMPSSERVRALLSAWKRYGYMIDQAFTPPQLNTMAKFTYWKTQGALINGSTPQEKRQTIAQAFDRGLTVWTDLSDIGTDVTAANTPLPGISY